MQFITKVVIKWKKVSILSKNAYKNITAGVTKFVTS